MEFSKKERAWSIPADDAVASGFLVWLQQGLEQGRLTPSRTPQAVFGREQLTY